MCILFQCCLVHAVHRIETEFPSPLMTSKITLCYPHYVLVTLRFFCVQNVCIQSCHTELFLCLKPSSYTWTLWMYFNSRSHSVYLRKIRAQVGNNTSLTLNFKQILLHSSKRSTGTPLLIQPFARIDFAKRSFRCAVPPVWNSLPAFVIGSDSLTVFKFRLKTFLFHRSFN